MKHNDKESLLIDEIKIAMAKNGISQVYLADRLKVFQSNISAILSKKRSAGLEQLITIAHAVGVDDEFVRQLICWH